MAENSRLFNGASVQQYGAVEASTSATSVTQENMNENIRDKKSTLKLFEKIGYGLGHVYNDLCAGVWFSYTLLFMQGALKMPATEAGALVMLGQVGDAIATPIVGFLTDKYGTKRQWHIAGTFLVFITFPMIFSICPLCHEASKWWEVLYFTIIILLFQFGWPIVQITHLAMIPELSKSQKDRSDLTAVRYSVSICSSVVVYVVTWAVLHGRNKTDNNIGPDDAYRFRDISLILSLVGVSMSVLFNFSLSLSNYGSRRQTALQHNVRQPDTERLLPSDEQEVAVLIPKKNFFKSPLLYQNALLYVFSRLFMTTSLVYMPLWLNERSWTPATAAGQTNNSNVEHIATVPLVSFLASFITSMLLKYTNRLIGTEVIYLIGSIISLSVCVWIELASSADMTNVDLFAIAILFGIGSSITMISSLCITAEMIGSHADQGGFIYSAVTFTDKLITGIVVVIIESMKCKDINECPQYYRSVLAYACGTAAILGSVTLTTIKCTKSLQRT